MFRRPFVTPLLAILGCLPGAASGLAQTPQQPAPQQTAIPLPEVYSHENIPIKDPVELAKRMKEAEAWKKKYAFQSLAERLKYEAPARNGSAPALSDDAAKRLEELDSRVESSAIYLKVRASSLKMLHTMEVKEFAERSGFGVARAITPGSKYIDLHKDKLEYLATVLPPSAEEAHLPPTTLLREDSSATNVPTAITQFLPTRPEMFTMHDRSVDNFAGTWSFGWIKSRNEVAGFEPHQFIYQPQTPTDAADRPVAPDPKNPPSEESYWKLTRLELVSLLKHETPRVYDTADRLPTMEELSSKNAETRPLAKFETAALEKLRGGEDIHTSSTPNRIEMLGAIRASKQCLQCHEVPRGTLLGAFSYELRRDPPVKFEPRSTSIQ